MSDHMYVTEPVWITTRHKERQYIFKGANEYGKKFFGARFFGVFVFVTL